MFSADKNFENADFICNKDFSGKCSHLNPWENPYKDRKSACNEPKTIGLPLFRKTFELCGAVKKTQVFVTALGLFELWINGSRVGEDMLHPGWTDYRKRVLYHTYDVSELLHEGKNCIFAAVSPGWYCGSIAMATYGENPPAFMCALDIKLSDGTENRITTAPDWQTAIGGAIRYSDIWDGEIYDANQPSYELLSLPEYKEVKWSNAQLCDYFCGTVTKMTGAPINKIFSLKPTSCMIYDGITENGSDFGELKALRECVSFPLRLKPGQHFILDFGQNISGLLNIKLRSRKAARVTLAFAEMLNDSGLASRGNDGPKNSLYTSNYRYALSRDTYVTCGFGNTEHFCPTFTYHGYRYAEITADAEIEIVDALSDVISAQMTQTGNITTSDKSVNRLINNIMWGQRGNFLSVPTDCPQRDERLGWTGDAQIFCRTAAFNADVSAFFRKWLQDMRDAQSPDGAYPHVAPNVRVMADTAPAAWADAGIIVPFTMAQMYGDLSFIEDNYDSMERYMHFLERFGLDGPQPVYGDWLGAEYTQPQYISMAYYAHDAQLMSQMSEKIGKKDRADYYRALGNKISEAFALRYPYPQYYESSTQTACILAICFRLFDDEKIKGIGKILKEKIVGNGFRMSTGFVGTAYIMKALCETGESGLAYTLLQQREYPSWLYSVDQGATTVWERWNSYTLKDGFGSNGMNSFNHYSYGAVGEWMYSCMAGIAPASDGFKKVLLKPYPDIRRDEDILPTAERISFVKADYNSSSGKIVSEWMVENGEFYYRCSVSDSQEGTVLLPIFGNSEFFWNDRLCMASDFEINDGRCVIRLQTGVNVFRMKYE